MASENDEIRHVEHRHSPEQDQVPLHFMSLSVSHNFRKVPACSSSVYMEGVIIESLNPESASNCSLYLSGFSLGLKPSTYNDNIILLGESLHHGNKNIQFN